MNEANTLEQWLKLQLHKKAVERRKQAAENGTLLEIRTMLEKHFGDDFEIKNINEDGTFSLINMDDYTDKLVEEYSTIELESILAGISHYLCYNILIRFADITITNSDDKQHTIKDLFVKIHCDHTGKFISLDGSYMKGIRATVTRMEVSHNYAHSHLPSQDDSNIEFTAFCLGEAPIIDIFSDLNECYNQRKFELLLLYIKAFVIWESLEGRPHKSIGDFQTLSYASQAPDMITVATCEVKEYVIEAMKRLPKDHFIKMLDITMDSDGFKVNLTESGYDSITKILQDSQLFNTNMYFSVKDRHGTFIKYDLNLSEDDDTEYSDGAYLFHFNNKPIKYKIEANEDNTIKPKIYPNPHITNAIRAYFSEELYRKYLQRSSF